MAGVLGGLFVAIGIIVSILVFGCLEKWRPSIIGGTCPFFSKIRVFPGDGKDVTAYV